MIYRKKEIFALGVGHNTPVFIDLAEACGYKVLGLYHYNSERTGQKDHGFTILGSFEDLFSLGDLSGRNFLLTMGDNYIRAKVAEQILSLGGNVPTLIHPTAVISRFATISPVGVYISAFTFVQADTLINKGTILLSGVNVSHTNNIGCYCFVAGGCTIGAYTKVGDFVFFGIASHTISSKVDYVGGHAYIGAGSLLTKSVEAYNVVMGSPAKVIRVIEHE